MELKDYIAETLVQITNGIIEAQKRLQDSDVIINPAQTFGSKGDFWIGKNQDKGPVARRVQEVEMKIGVISTEETTEDGGAKLHLGVLNLGAGIEDKGMERNENYVKFSIPVSFPVIDYEPEKE
jgi:hypothetical protein